MIDSLPSLLGTLTGILPILQNKAFNKEKNLDEALTAILEAVTRTKKYLERENIETQDRNEELELSRLWGIAAIKLRRVDPNLAQKLQIKSLYWEATTRFSRKEILENGIALKQIKEDYEGLFSAKQYKRHSKP
jgi:hypothetical protein